MIEHTRRGGGAVEPRKILVADDDPEIREVLRLLPEGAPLAREQALAATY